jgi:hypothetical protein
MAEKQPNYLSYLLRLWQTTSDGERIWRASVESPDTGERQGFSSLETLFDFLQDQTGQTVFSDAPTGDYDRLKGGAPPRS